MRMLAEVKLLEFIVSVKLNLENWPRAYLFCLITGFIIPTTAMKTFMLKDATEKEDYPQAIDKHA